MHTARFSLALVLLAPLALAVPACSGDDSSTTSSGDDGGSSEASGGGQDGGGGGGDSGGGTDSGGGDAAPTVCNNLTPATPVPIMVRHDTIPTPAGGSISDGTYAVAAAGIYLGAADAGVSTVGTTDTKMQVQGTTVNVTQTSNGKVTTETDTFTVSGTSLTITPTCPSGRTGTSAGFTARTANADAGIPNGGFDLIVTTKGVTAVLTLAKQ